MTVVEPLVIRIVTTSLPSHVFAFQNTVGTCSLFNGSISTRRCLEAKDSSAPNGQGMFDSQQTFWNFDSVSLFLTVAAMTADLDPLSPGKCVRNKLIVDVKGSIRSGS